MSKAIISFFITMNYLHWSETMFLIGTSFTSLTHNYMIDLKSLLQKDSDMYILIELTRKTADFVGVSTYTEKNWEAFGGGKCI